MPLAGAEFFGRLEGDAETVAMEVAAEETPQVADASSAMTDDAARPQGDAPLADGTQQEAPDIAAEPEPSLDDLARTLVEAAAEAAKSRSRRHTVVYSARPLDEAEMEAVAAYVAERLDAPGADDLDATTTTDVRIVVDGQVVEGTLDINDEPDLVNVVDESLIMGIRIVRGDTVIDGSLRHRLDQLKHTMHS